MLPYLWNSPCPWLPATCLFGGVGVISILALPKFKNIFKGNAWKCLCERILVKQSQSSCGFYFKSPSWNIPFLVVFFVLQKLISCFAPNRKLWTNLRIKLLLKINGQSISRKKSSSKLLWNSAKSLLFEKPKSLQLKKYVGYERLEHFECYTRTE